MSNDSRHPDRTGHDADIDALRTLDPAGPPDPRAGTAPPARAMLERILATPHEGPATATTSRTSRRRPRRWGYGAAAAGVAAAGLVIAIASTSGEPAFATWTPVPTGVPAAQRPDLAAECSAADADHLVLAEDRGRMTLVLEAQQDHLEYCLLADGRWVMDAYASIQPSDRAIASDEVRTQVASSSTPMKGDLEAFGVIAGRVGPEVQRIVIHPPSGGPDDGPSDVTATIESGYFAAWWPGDLAGGTPSLTVHLDDGTVTERPAFLDRE